MKVENKKSKYAGFSLMEMIVAIFVFSIVMTTVMAVFVNISTSRKKIKAIQKDVEDARFSMELIAKTLRMSSVKTGNASNLTDITIYDYSQGKCVRYKFDSTAHKFKSGSVAGAVTDCLTSSVTDASLSDMTGGNISSAFFDSVQSSDGSVTPKKFGKVTIAMKVCYKGVCTGNSGDAAVIQTTVSLRDYQVVNP